MVKGVVLNKSRVFLSVMLIGFFAVGGKADEAKTDDMCSSFVTHYYLHPEPAKAAEILEAMLKSESSMNKSVCDEHCQDMKAYFFARICRDDPNLVRIYERFFEDGLYRQRVFMLKIFRLCGDEKTKKFLTDKMGEERFIRQRDAIKLLLEEGMPQRFDPLTKEISKGGDLDFLWTEFFATGDEKAVRKIIDTLDRCEARDLKVRVVGLAARWSLGSNCREHRKVFDICRSELAITNEAVKTPLREIVCKNSDLYLTGNLSDEKMVRIVYRDITPGIDANSFAAKPKTLYRVGKKYGRLEEQPDPVNGIYELIIVNEPHCWMVNLSDNKALHIVDTDPNGEFRSPIIPGEILGSVSGFENGIEIEFMKAVCADRSVIKIDNKKYDLFLVKFGNHNVVELIAEKNTEIPYMIRVNDSNGVVFATVYDSYQVDLKPDMSLFEVSAGVKITEAKDVNDEGKEALDIAESSNIATDTNFSEAAKGWALGCSAILTERNHKKHDLLGCCEKTERNVTQTKKLLDKEWGITSRKELLETLQTLKQGGHRKRFNRLGEYIKRLDDAEYQKFLKNNGCCKERLNEIEIVKKYYDELGGKSLLGWDYCRYINLCRWGYLSGYLSEQEAWGKIIPVARMLQKKFDSWEDIGRNYLIGRQFWSYEQTQKNGNLYEDAYKRLLEMPSSPWNKYPWKTKLD